MHKIYQSFKQDLDQMCAGHQKHRQNVQNQRFVVSFQKWLFLKGFIRVLSGVCHIVVYHFES